MPQSVTHFITNLDHQGQSVPLRSVALDQRQRGHAVRVLTYVELPELRQQLTEAGIGGQSFRRRGPLDFITMGRLAKSLRTEPSDVLHVWDAGVLQDAQLTLPRDDSPQLFASLDTQQLQPDVNRKLVHALRNKVARLFVPDEATCQLGQELGLSDERLTLIRPGVARQEPSRSRAEWLTELELPEEAQLIISWGALTPEKQLDEAIWVYELVRTLHPHARLLILGDGPDRGRLERHARMVSDPACFRFLGERPDAVALLPQAEVFWQTDAGAATPWTLLQAMAQSVAVVANETPTDCRYVTHDQNGLLAIATDRAAFAKQTCRLLEDAKLRHRLEQAAGQHVAEHFSLTAMLTSYAEAYAEFP